MAKNNERYFGELIINETEDDEEIYLKFIGKDIVIFLPEYVINDRNKIKKCFEIMDRYIEMDDFAKKSIIKNYPQIKRARMDSKYIFINMENSESVEYLGIINDNRKDIVEKLMNKELKIIINE